MFRQSKPLFLSCVLLLLGIGPLTGCVETAVGAGLDQGLHHE